jgi:hypothetical protein
MPGISRGLQNLRLPIVGRPKDPLHVKKEPVKGIELRPKDSLHDAKVKKEAVKGIELLPIADNLAFIGTKGVLFLIGVELLGNINQEAKMLLLIAEIFLPHIVPLLKLGILH